MTTEFQPFSKRFGFAGSTPLVHDSAPIAFRHAVLALLTDAFTLSSRVLNLVQLLAGVPRPAAQFMLDDELARTLIEQCDWVRVFEIAEEGFRRLPIRSAKAALYEQGLNAACHANYVGWYMQEGQLKVRGTDAEEVALNATIDVLQAAGKTTTAAELKAARDDLSRLPHPDVTGAMQHAGAAIECFARDLSNSKDTFGALISKHPSLFPGAYRKIAEGVWAVVTNQGRHLQEGGEPTFEEAMMFVGIIASLTGYLTYRAGLDLI
jgi:hypothetical protein